MHAIILNLKPIKQGGGKFAGVLRSSSGRVDMLSKLVIECC